MSNPIECAKAYQPADRAQLIAELVAVAGGWLHARCSSASVGLPGISTDDLFQETLLRLWRSPTPVDLTRPQAELRVYLARTVDWVAKDLGRSLARRSRVEILLDVVRADISGIESAVPDAIDQMMIPDTDEDLIARIQHLIAPARLSKPQSDAVCNELADRSLTSHDFACLVDRSPDQVRKDKERGLRKLRAWLGLTPHEQRVFGAVRRFRSTNSRATPAAARVTR